MDPVVEMFQKMFPQGVPCDKIADVVDVARRMNVSASGNGHRVVEFIPTALKISVPPEANEIDEPSTRWNRSTSKDASIAKKVLQQVAQHAPIGAVPLMNKVGVGKYVLRRIVEDLRAAGKINVTARGLRLA